MEMPLFTRTQVLTGFPAQQTALLCLYPFVLGKPEWNYSDCADLNTFQDSFMKHGICTHVFQPNFFPVNIQLTKL